IESTSEPTLFNNNISDIEIKKEIRLDIESIENFSTYFLAQIKEMLYKNEARSIKIEERVAPLYKKESSPESKQLLRMILEENGALIQSFWEQVRKDLIPLGVQPNENRLIEFIDEAKATIIIRKRQNIFSELEDFLIESGEVQKTNATTTIETPINESLLNYLRIKTFLAIVDDKESDNGDNIKELTLDKKTHALCKSIEQLFTNSNAKLGSFFIVKYREQDTAEEVEIEDVLFEKGIIKDNTSNQQGNDLTKFMFTAYNEGYAKVEVDDCLYEKENYIARVIEGITNKKFPNENEDNDSYKIAYNVTIDIIAKKSVGENQFEMWESLYAVPNLEKIEIDFLRERKDVNYILILRFSEKTIKEQDDKLKKEPLGAIILYSDKNIFTYQKNRYLLLLRKSISNFLSKHHKNDEFRD
ncbi:MAG: hypothetical protein Q8T08_02840, partial [Ignavibacteria bacterium]|nr:hypothetical protein [Ignavibacteria bacterium]